MAEEISEQQAAVQKSLAASSLGPLAHRLENIAEVIVEDGPGDQLQGKTHIFSRPEVHLYARMDYLLRLTDAVARQDEDGGFQFPDFDHLLRADYRLRNSWRQQTRKILESITKIFDRGPGGEGGGRGFMGRRRG
jgi:hypothetical protein